MSLLSLDRHDVLETIRQSNSLHEAFIRVAILPAVGEYRTATNTNADRIRAMGDIELGNFLSGLILGCSDCPMYEECDGANCNSRWQKWLKEEAT